MAGMGIGQFSLARLFIATALAAAGFGILQIVWYGPNNSWLLLAAALASFCFGAAVDVLTKQHHLGGYAAGLAMVAILLTTSRAVE